MSRLPAVSRKWKDFKLLWRGWRPSLKLQFAVLALLWIGWTFFFLTHHWKDIGDYLALQPAKSQDYSLFGFSEYLAALALLLVILSNSDFKYRFRLSLTTFNAQKFAFLVSFLIGFLILLIDAWFNNGWLIPARLNNANNLRLFLALFFFGMVCYLNYIAFVSPPRFGRLNARSAFNAMHHFVARGNPDHLTVIGDWIGTSADRIITIAAGRGPENASLGGGRSIGYRDYAAYTLSLLGSRKLCHQMVDKSPWSIAELFRVAAKFPRYKLPMSPFARNIGSELVANSGSALYSEDEGFTSGFLGYTKPITTLVYGNFELIESLASEGGSPLDLEFDLSFDLTASQLTAYSRAVRIFAQSYFSQPYPHHSYAFFRALHQIEIAIHSIRGLGKLGDEYWKSDDYNRLKVAIRLIRDLMKLLAKYPAPTKQKKREFEFDGLRLIHAQVAKLIFEIISAASHVAQPASTSWNVQHNNIWADLFAYDKSASSKLVQFYLRRLLYDEIKEVGMMPHFVNVRILGYCLHVFGISEPARTGVERSDFAPVSRSAVHWAKHNYLKLVKDNPVLAETCLMGGISFDPDGKRLIRTYASMLGREPARIIPPFLTGFDRRTYAAICSFSCVLSF